MRRRLEALLHDRSTILRQSLFHPGETSGMPLRARYAWSEGDLLGDKVVSAIRLKGGSHAGCLLFSLSRLLALLLLIAGEQ